MNAAADANAKGYESAYKDFDSPLMRQLRLEAYGEDIGQHSWVTADDLRHDSARLHLSPSTHLLDLGCGPCGPLTFLLSSVGCRGTGIELSAAALEVGRTRATAMGVDHLLSVHEADLNAPIPLSNASFGAAMSLDMVLHVRDRAAFFREVARTLAPGGRFLFTDAGVLTGVISEVEVARRSVNGFTQFVAPGFNERLLERAGFRLLEVEDRTASVVKQATGRMTARLAHRTELEQLNGPSAFEREQQYLETVIELSSRGDGGVSRLMYLAESCTR